MASTAPLIPKEANDVDYGVRSFTKKEMRKLANQEHTEVIEFTTDRKKEFDPLPLNRVIQMRFMIRKRYAELLELLPEASDEQLRTLLVEGIPAKHQDKVKWFVSHYIVSTMQATTRTIVDDLFQEGIQLTRIQQKAIVESKGDVLKQTEKVADYMRDNNVFFNCRDFTQLRGLKQLPTEEVPEPLRELLEMRRKGGERPGAGILARPKMEAMKDQHERLRDSVRKHRDDFGKKEWERALEMRAKKEAASAAVDA